MALADTEPMAYFIWLIVAGTGIASAIVGGIYRSVFKRELPEAVAYGIWLSPIPIGMFVVPFVYD